MIVQKQNNKTIIILLLLAAAYNDSVVVVGIVVVAENKYNEFYKKYLRKNYIYMISLKNNISVNRLNLDIASYRAV